LLDRPDLIERRGRGGGQPQAQVGCHLIVAAAPGMEFACRRADDLPQAALGGGVNVLVARHGLERPGGEFRAHLFQTGEDRQVFFLGQDARPGQRARPRLAAGDVRVVQPPIERQAVVELANRVIRLLPENPAPQSHLGPLQKMHCKGREEDNTISASFAARVWISRV
jgi:hypothetical protein